MPSEPTPQAASAEPTRRDLHLRGHRIHVVEAGSGPTILFVHGLLVHHAEWLPLIVELAPYFRCVALDLPGFGRSSKPSPSEFAYTREAFAEVVAEAQSALGIVRCHVAGHSMGGGIAITLAADHPELVDRLVLADPISLPFPLPIKGKLPLLPVMGPFVFKHLYRRALFHDYFKNDVWNGHAGIDLRQVDDYYDAFDPPEAREAAYASLLHAVSDVGSLGPKLARVRAKTLVLWGDDDRLVPTHLATKVAREIPGARMRIIDGSGHSPIEEHPARVAELVRAHLEGRDG